MTKSTDNDLQGNLRTPLKASDFVYEKQADLFGGPETCAKVRKTKVIEIPEEDHREPSERGQFSAGRRKRK